MVSIKNAGEEKRWPAEALNTAKAIENRHNYEEYEERHEVP